MSHNARSTVIEPKHTDNGSRSKFVLSNMPHNPCRSIGNAQGYQHNIYVIGPKQGDRKGGTYKQVLVPRQLEADNRQCKWNQNLLIMKHRTTNSGTPQPRGYHSTIHISNQNLVYGKKTSDNKFWYPSNMGLSLDDTHFEPELGVRK